MEQRAESEATMTKPIEVDGAMGEGGGQVLRSALSLSLLTGQSFRLSRIRANRDRPGLRPQHLAAVRAAATVSGADVRGDRVGSEEIEFAPGPVRPGDYFFDIGTAGATSLVLQTLLLPLALADGPSELRTSEVTAHLLTNAKVIRLFLPVEIGVDGPIGGPGAVQVRPVPAHNGGRTREMEDPCSAGT
jgi:RNA 3'-terminal phosphate cyclase